MAAPKAVVISAEEKSPHAPLSYHRATSNGVTLHLVSFDSRSHQLRVIDQPNGPGSQWPDAATLGKTKNALAAINAGFFTPEGKPLGRLIANGTKRGHDNPSSLGSGFLYFSPSHAGIARRQSLKGFIKKFNPAELLQSGPMLSYQGRVVKGLSSTRPRPRSFIASNGSHHWLIGYAENATLAQLGTALSGQTLGGVKIYHAINLDGGRSSDLWVAPSVQNGDKTFRAFWNKPVRNFLILTKK